MKIEYGIGRDYLPDWGVQEARRDFDLILARMGIRINDSL